MAITTVVDAVYWRGRRVTRVRRRAREGGKEGGGERDLHQRHMLLDLSSVQDDDRLTHRCDKTKSHSIQLEAGTNSLIVSVLRVVHVIEPLGTGDEHAHDGDDSAGPLHERDGLASEIQNKDEQERMQTGDDRSLHNRDILQSTDPVDRERERGEGGVSEVRPTLREGGERDQERRFPAQLTPAMRI
jgi:hypothetical protein